MFCFVDDILWRGTSEFKSEVIDPLSKIFVNGYRFSKALTYRSTEINKNKDHSAIIGQESYPCSTNIIQLKKDRISVQ